MRVDSCGHRARYAPVLEGASHSIAWSSAERGQPLEPSNVPGQSGQPGSPHYNDLPLWRAGRCFQLAYLRNAVDAVTTNGLAPAP